MALKISDIYIKLGFCKSRKEFKRQAATGSVRINDFIIEDDMELVPIADTFMFGIVGPDNCYAIPPIFHKMSECGEWLIIQISPK